MDTHLKRFVIALVLFTLPLIYFCLNVFNTGWSLPLLTKQPSSLPAANSTLGFGAILAVSHSSSPRRKDLSFAADLTGLNIQIPDQPTWTDNDVEAFKSTENSRIQKGSALAWMGHLNALTWFLSTSLETALILEDDVDWDIHLRTSQVPLAASALRQLLTNLTTDDTPEISFWGSPSWEILYLGHCGDMFDNSSLKLTPHHSYHDASLPEPAHLHTKTAAFLRQIGLSDYTRIVHRSRWPLCTFGYAVTRSSAQRILDNFSNEGNGGCQAFDVRILEACRDKGWQCYTVNPELFHHIEAPSEIDNVNWGIQAGMDEHGRLKRQNLKETPNIACGARQRDFYTEDNDTLTWLREEVGERGHCFIDHMEADMSTWP